MPSSRAVQQVTTACYTASFLSEQAWLFIGLVQMGSTFIALKSNATKDGIAVVSALKVEM